MNFTTEELELIYNLVEIERDNNKDDLDWMEATHPIREDVLQSFKLSNSILRKVKKLIAESKSASAK